MIDSILYPVCMFSAAQFRGFWTEEFFHRAQKSTSRQHYVHQAGPNDRSRFHFNVDDMGTIHHTRSHQSFIFYFRLFLHLPQRHHRYCINLLCSTRNVFWIFSRRQDPSVLQRYQWPTTESRPPSPVLFADRHSGGRRVLQPVRPGLHAVRPDSNRSRLCLHTWTRWTGKSQLLESALIIFANNYFVKSWTASPIG